MKADNRHQGEFRVVEDALGIVEALPDWCGALRRFACGPVLVAGGVCNAIAISWVSVQQVSSVLGERVSV